MLRDANCRVPRWLALLLFLSALGFCQDSGLVGPLLRGPFTHDAGVFITPVSNAPFSAILRYKSTWLTANGSIARNKTLNVIARDSNGRTHSESRILVQQDFTGTPRLVYVHIYDPVTRTSTFLNIAGRLARQAALPEPIPTSAPWPPKAQGNPLIKDEDLGNQTIEGLTVHGLRRSQTIPANTSGTGNAVVVTTEYWYSEDLHLNMLIKHSDPRHGELQSTVTDVNRAEPDPALFQIPQGYKVVDETPKTQ